MSKLADGEEVEEVDLFKPILPVWVYGINDHLDVARTVFCVCLLQP